MPEFVGTIITVVVVVILLLIVASCICVVPQASAWVIEALGKYKETWSAGLHFKVPIFYKVTKKVSLKEQVRILAPICG